MPFTPQRPHRRIQRMIHRGQILVLALIIIFLLFLTATALIDVYNLLEARNWGYRVAQQAAIAGASNGRDWAFFQPTPDPLADTPTPWAEGECVPPGKIQLIDSDSRNAAFAMLTTEMSARGFTYPGGYTYQIEVITDPNGGTGPAGFPPGNIRLGSGLSQWSTDTPAVGVYLSFSVQTFLMSIVGRGTVTIHVFAAAEVAQPEQCP
jgi:hypothetical protein